MRNPQKLPNQKLPTLGILFKSHIHGYWRTAQGGKRVWVREHDDKRTTHSEAEVAGDARLSAEAAYKEHGTKSVFFKQWFGDWEHDPAHASKVVNAEGEPQENYGDGTAKVVYHGTANGGFTHFDNDKVNPGSLYGPGHYFTEDRSVAETYKEKGAKRSFSRPITDDDVARVRQSVATQMVPWDDRPLTPDTRRGIREFALDPGAKSLEVYLLHGEHGPKIAEWLGVRFVTEPGAEVKAVYLNIRNPLNMDAAVSESMCRRLWAATPNAEYEPFENAFAGYRQASPHALNDVLRVKPPAVSYPASGKDMYLLLCRRGIGGGGEPAQRKAVNAILQAQGFDGITHIGGNIMGKGHNHRVWIAFQPEQIKAVENTGTFDDTDPDMYKSVVSKAAAAGRKPSEAKGKPAQLPDFDALDARLGQEMARCARDYDGGRADLQKHHAKMTAQEAALVKKVEALRPQVEGLLEGTSGLTKPVAQACLAYMKALADLHTTRQGKRLAYGATVPAGTQPLGQAIGTPDPEKVAERDGIVPKDDIVPGRTDPTSGPVSKSTNPVSKSTNPVSKSTNPVSKSLPLLAVLFKAANTYYHGTDAEVGHNQSGVHNQSGFHFAPHEGKRFVGLGGEDSVVSHGTFLAHSPETASQYGKNVLAVHTNLSKPLVKPGDVNGHIPARRMGHLKHILSPLIQESRGLDSDGKPYHEKYIEAGAFRHTISDGHGHEEHEWPRRLMGEGGLDWGVLDHPEVAKRMRQHGYDHTFVHEPDDEEGSSVFVPHPHALTGSPYLSKALPLRAVMCKAHDVSGEARDHDGKWTDEGAGPQPVSGQESFLSWRPRAEQHFGMNEGQARHWWAQEVGSAVRRGERVPNHVLDDYEAEMGHVPLRRLIGDFSFHGETWTPKTQYKDYVFTKDRRFAAQAPAETPKPKRASSPRPKATKEYKQMMASAEAEMAHWDALVAPIHAVVIKRLMDKWGVEITPYDASQLLRAAAQGDKSAIESVGATSLKKYREAHADDAKKALEGTATGWKGNASYMTPGRRAASAVSAVAHKLATPLADGLPAHVGNFANRSGWAHDSSEITGHNAANRLTSVHHFGVAHGPTATVALKNHLEARGYTVGPPRLHLPRPLGESENGPGSTHARGNASRIKPGQSFSATARDGTAHEFHLHSRPGLATTDKTPPTTFAAAPPKPPGLNSKPAGLNSKPPGLKVPGFKMPGTAGFKMPKFAFRFSKPPVAPTSRPTSGKTGNASGKPADVSGKPAGPTPTLPSFDAGATAQGIGGTLHETQSRVNKPLWGKPQTVHEHLISHANPKKAARELRHQLGVTGPTRESRQDHADGNKAHVYSLEHMDTAGVKHVIHVVRPRAS